MRHGVVGVGKPGGFGHRGVTESARVCRGLQKPLSNEALVSLPAHFPLDIPSSVVRHSLDDATRRWKRRFEAPSACSAEPVPRSNQTESDPGTRQGTACRRPYGSRDIRNVLPTSTAPVIPIARLDAPIEDEPGKRFPPLPERGSRPRCGQEPRSFCTRAGRAVGRFAAGPLKASARGARCRSRGDRPLRAPFAVARDGFAAGALRAPVELALGGFAGVF